MTNPQLSLAAKHTYQLEDANTACPKAKYRFWKTSTFVKYDWKIHESHCLFLKVGDLKALDSLTEVALIEENSESILVECDFKTTI